MTFVARQNQRYRSPGELGAIFGLLGITLTTRFRELGTSRPATQKAGATAPALTCICDGGGGRI